MNNNNKSTDVLIVKNVLDYLNERQEEIGLPCPIELEDIAPKGMSMSLQQITGEKYVQQDITGDESGSFPFAIYSQNTNVDKLGIIKPLWNISDYFDKHKQDMVFNDGKLTVNIEMTGTPGLFSRTKDGTVTYQAIYKVQYYKEV